MTQLQRLPVAAAVLRQGKYSWAWVVRTCPYCGKLHEHFGGSLDSDPQRYLGRPVTARCDPAARQQRTTPPPAGARMYILEAESEAARDADS